MLQVIYELVPLYRLDIAMQRAPLLLSFYLAYPSLQGLQQVVEEAFSPVILFFSLPLIPNLQYAPMNNLVQLMLHLRLVVMHDLPGPIPYHREVQE